MKPKNEEQMADGHAVASGGDERDNTNAPQFLEEVVEMQRLAPHEQELQLPPCICSANGTVTWTRASMRYMS